MPLERALETIDQAPDVQITNGLAVALRTLGNAAFNARRPADALRVYHEGVRVGKRLRAPLVEASFLANEGVAETTLGDPVAALESQNAALDACDRGHASDADRASVFSARGITRKNLGDPQGGIDDYRSALSLLESSHDEVSIARVLNNLGLAEYVVGDYKAAREHFERGLRIAREKKQRLGEAFLLNNISAVYVEENSPELAADYALQAVRIKQELGDTEDLASSLVNLSRTYWLSHRMAEAKQAADQAYAAALKSRTGRMIPSACAQQAQLDSDSGDLTASEARLREGLKAARDRSLALSESELQSHLASVEFQEGRYQQARDDADAAMQRSQEQGFVSPLIESALLKGRAERKLGHTAEAQAALETSLHALETTRDQLAGSDEVRTQFFADHAGVYQELVSLYLEQGRAAKAFEVSEAEKGRALLDMLTRGKPRLSEGLSETERGEERGLLTRISLLESAQSKGAADKPRGHEMEAARAALSRFRERMYAQHPDLARHQGFVPLLRFEDTNALLSPSTLLLEYEVTPDATFLFTVAQERGKPVLRVHRIPVAGDALGMQVERFRRTLSTRSSTFAASAAALYKTLLAPAQKELSGRRDVVIVPAGALWRLPFQALAPAPGAFLIDRVSVTLEPSFSIERADLHRTAERANRLVAFGDPAQNLPEASREVRELAAVYGTRNARIFTATEATTGNFNAFAPRYPVVHLATHGVLDDRQPMYSHLVLASAAHGAERLDAEEIAHDDIAAQLVVLSGCDTADGQLRQGEGLIGLSYAFLAAGAHTVVASQWRVDSASTTALMLAFHRYLRAGVQRSQALRRAEMDVAHDSTFRHPFYWAPFVLIGQR